MQLRSRMAGRVNLLTGTITPEDSFGEIAPRRNTDGSFEALILPQAADDYRSDEGLLRITSPEGDGNYVYTFTQPSMEFLPLLPNGGTGDDDPDQEQNRNAVFQFFKDYAQNKGSWNSRGVRWFITGDNTGIPSENGSSCFPGFFAEVFKQTDVIATDSKRSPTEEEFNEFMVNALRNRQAIGFTAHDIAGTNTGAHAMVIWGAEFDAEGKIAYVYFCDNNYADQDVNGAVITRRGICLCPGPHDVVRVEADLSATPAAEEREFGGKQKIPDIESVRRGSAAGYLGEEIPVGEACAVMRDPATERRGNENKKRPL